MYSSFSFSTWTGHISSAPSWWGGGGEGEGEGGGGGEGEKVHLLTYAPLGGCVGKKHLLANFTAFFALIPNIQVFFIHVLDYQNFMLYF